MDEDTTNERVVYTPREVAKLLGVDRTTVYRRMREGSIPVVQMGTGRKYISKKRFEELFS
jgi:excisionase family DNA binding protein